MIKRDIEEKSDYLHILMAWMSRPKKIGRMEGSEEDNGKVSQDGDGFRVGRFLMAAFWIYTTIIHNRLLMFIIVWIMAAKWAANTI